jgi:hypothetical protein
MGHATTLRSHTTPATMARLLSLCAAAIAVALGSSTSLRVSRSGAAARALRSRDVFRVNPCHTSASLLRPPSALAPLSDGRARPHSLSADALKLPTRRRVRGGWPARVKAGRSSRDRCLTGVDWPSFVARTPRTHPTSLCSHDHHFRIQRCRPPSPRSTCPPSARTRSAMVRLNRRKYGGREDSAHVPLPL